MVIGTTNGLVINRNYLVIAQLTDGLNPTVVEFVTRELAKTSDRSPQSSLLLGTLHSEGQRLIGHPVRVPPQDLQGCDRYLLDKLSILRGTISPVVVSPNNIGSCGRINLPVSTQRSSC